MTDKINFESHIPYYIQLIDILKEKVQLDDRHERACYRLPRCRHFVSTRMVAEERERMLDLPKGFFDVQPLGVDVSRFAPAGHRANMRALLGATDKTCIIVTVARFVALKNHAWTIRALEKLPEHVTVVLVGDGPQRATLERSIPAALRPRIHFVGQQDPVPYLEAADVFALPSRVESFGIAYAEAMAMGLPCVGLQYRPPLVLSSAEEVIGSDACGFVVADEQEYRTALHKLTDDPVLRKRMGAAAQARSATADHRSPRG
jgi:glycosyltransferase involved in cell wall biosynthesis